MAINKSATQPRRVLAPEQLRYCISLLELGEADAQALSEAYAVRRGENDNYIKTYTQLRRMEKAEVVQRREVERHTPPFDALRRVSLWSLTTYGAELVRISIAHYRQEYITLQSEDTPER